MNRGLGYERKVKGVVQQAARLLPELSVSTKSGLTQSDAPDLQLIFNKSRRVAVEVKMDARSQMGNPATVLYEKGVFKVARDDSIDAATQNLIVDELTARKRAADKFLAFIRSVPPEYNESARGFPLSCSKFAWDQAKEKGLLALLNVNVRRTADTILRHYEKKNCFYMQIGGHGLFYLRDNPLDLPVPQLKGDVAIELRLAHHGGKSHSELGERVTGDMRANIRLLTRDKSPWSLDRKEDVLRLFN